MKNILGKIKLPVDAFDACPSCGRSEELRAIGIDVYCTGCGWDSLLAFVDAGGMTALIYAFEEEAALVKRYARREKRHATATPSLSV